jgi:hypothetical protein
VTSTTLAPAHDVGGFAGAGAGSAEQLSTTTGLMSQVGVSPSSLPSLPVVSPELRRDILAGKHVSLPKLLIPNYTEQAPREMQLGETTVSLKPLSDARLDRPLTRDQFIEAFSIYLSILLPAYPLRTGEMNSYFADIIQISSRYPGCRFFEYHTAFSRKAAQYLEKGIKMSWAERDNNLFTEYFSGQTPL